MKGAYHWRDGWHFARMADGSVEVYVAEASTRGPVKARAVIPASEWASIVHAVADPAADYRAIEAAINGPSDLTRRIRERQRTIGEEVTAIMVSRGTPDTPAAMAAELEAHHKRLNDPHLPWGYDQALALSRSLETAIAVLRSGA